MSPGVPAGGIDTAASGLVSVMPQPWITSMPKRSRNASIMTRGTAEPPATMPRRLERSASGLPSAARNTSFQIVGHAERDRGAQFAESS